MCKVGAARYLSRTANGASSAPSATAPWRTPFRRPSAPHFTDRGRQVVSMSGDGGFSMPMGDFLTLVQYGLPVKVVLFNNSSLGMVELEMSVSGLPAYGRRTRTPTSRPSRAWRARTGVRAEKPEQLTGALKDAFRHPGPARADGVTDPAAPSIPPKIRAGTVTGFARSASRIVGDGGVGPMIRMARSDLRNVPRP
ncbi:thiamine pyrophosphate-dependent enzyme [Streptomyces sp. NRRL S-241]|uniref:thiamine pyrophosphate-dependent enzyme n=1 Tax=Streptomyces sp. NRRL S-241 TaxID=1463896 RepID=UPI003B634C91